MINVSNVSLSFGTRKLFKDVNLIFNPGNCYGVIGANGAGKSTFLKILSGEIPADTGDINIPPNARMTVLKQDQNAYDEYTVMEAVIKGHEKLFAIMKERDELYSKAELTDEEGMRVGEIEGEFADMGGYEAESEAAILLSGLGVEEGLHEKPMTELEGNIKVRVLLAQALFGNPDILLLDEPTNHLDLESINWLEEFLAKFENTVIVVSHNRHFLNQVCTHICDVDYGQIKMYVGNYDFWYQMSQLIAKQKKDEKKRAEDKAAELKAFIQRFASNASKAKQATSRKKLLDKLSLDDLPSTSRRFPYVAFKPERECGKIVLDVKGLTYSEDGVVLFDNFNLTVERGHKVAFVGPLNQHKTAFFNLITGVVEPEAGEITWGVTISHSYFPKDTNRLFTQELPIFEWLKQYTDSQDETYIRGFLGRMLFSGEEALKPVNVLSGGEKVRCMLSRLMLSESNVIVMDEPTNHLDLEAITSLNTAMTEFGEVLLFNTHDHQLIETVATRIVEFTPKGMIDRMMPFSDYLADEGVKTARDEHWEHHERMVI